MKLAAIWHVFKTATLDWQRHNAPRLGAAIAYYAIFSIAPLLVVAIAIAGSVFGQQAAKGEVFEQVNRFLGSEQAARAIEDLVLSAARPRGGALATTLTFFALWFGATGVFTQIKGALDIIWEVERKPGVGWIATFIEYAWSIAMVAAVGLLLLASLVASSAMSAGVALAQARLPVSDLTLRSLDWSLSLVAITMLFAATFKFLPDVHVRWRDVWVGAAVTSVLFSIGKFVIGWYLARLVIASAYGAAGSFVLVLVWTYYSAQIFLFGAEVTQAYVRQIGAKVLPTRRSRFISSAEYQERLPRN
ncbi:MAG TPA: YihY/virulence factor BrkB family protein [Pirellulales bacterium]|jgi:membrane protein